MKRISLILSTLFILIACNNLEEDVLEENAPTSENINEQPADQEKNEDIDIKRFFKPADSTALFIGDGNEFASFTEKTKWLTPNYLASYIDNGGAVTMKVYRVVENEIVLVKDQLVEAMPEDDVYPDIASLDELPALETYLAGPIEVGTTFENWRIIDTGITLVTPYKTFENVFVIEETGAGFINRKYFVEDYGVIKTESVMSVEPNEEVTVTSSLKDIILQQ